MPQGSILGPLLFNIDLTDLFFTCENNDIASYTDDKTPYTCARATPTVISELQSTSEKLFNWFEKNHHKNLQSLAIEIYNFVNGLSSEIMNSVFHLKEYNRYSLRNVYQLYSRDLRTVKYGMEIISYLAPKIWSIVPQTITESTSVYSFKTKIRKWKPECQGQLCKRYLQHVGFVQR